jgi:hypothetical protein
LAGETEVFGENLLQRHIVHHKIPHDDRSLTPDRSGEKPATNRLSYGAAHCEGLLKPLRYGTRKPRVTRSTIELRLLNNEGLTIITKTEELLKSSVPRQRIQQQKERFYDNREINCSTRCPLFGTSRATSRGLLEDYWR